MKRAFKLENGDVVDAISHTIEVLSNHRDAKIYVGTDSQNKRYNTSYVVCIAYKYGTRGAHCIYHKENVKKIKDRHLRLWKEVEISLEIAKYLEENGFKVECVELDFNEKEMTRSHELVAAARGYVVGSGFNCKVKPEDGLSAVKYADWVVRGVNFIVNFLFGNKRNK